MIRLLFVIFSATVLSAQITPTSGLIAAYDFTPDTTFGQTLTDLSPSPAYSGTFGPTTAITINDPAAVPSGMQNESFRFVNIPSINITSDLTFVLRFRNIAGTTGASSTQEILNSFNLSSPFAGWGVSIQGTTHKIGYWSGTNGAWVYGNTAIQDGNWHTYIITVSNTAVAFYLNGMADGTQTSARPNAWSGTAAIGSTWNGSAAGSYFCGGMALLLVYNRVLTGGEIASVNTLANTYDTVTRPITPASIPVPPTTTTLARNGLAPTPPMGWDSWQYNHTVSAAQVKAQADAMVSSGLAAAGYQYILVAEPGMGRNGTTGVLTPNATLFPLGMTNLCDYIHGIGLKCGGYSSPNLTTCAGNVGSLEFPYQDAQTFASWGIDYIHYDMCGLDEGPMAGDFSTFNGTTLMQAYYQALSEGVRASGRSMVMHMDVPSSSDTTSSLFYSPQNWFKQAGYNVMVPALGGDITCDYSDIALKGFDYAADLEAISGFNANTGPGYWIGADWLLTGCPGLSDAAGRTMMSQWSMLASPLEVSIDLTTMTMATKTTLTNSDIIAVDQDALGIRGVRIVADTVSCGSATCEVWARQLAAGSCALELANRASTTQSITVTFAHVAAVVPACGSGPYTITRDLWAHSSLGTLTTSYTASVASHDVATIKVTTTVPSPAALPQTYLNTSYIPPTGSTIVVHSGDNLQTAINNAVRGDEIVLDAGAKWTGNYTLPSKSGTGWVTIRSSGMAALPEGTRVSPSQVASMATISTATSAAVLKSASAASNWQLIGLEITLETSATGNFGLLVFGDNSETLPNLPTNFFVERCYIHGAGTIDVQRGVAMNGISQAVVDSYISDIKWVGGETQGINGYAGPGPFKIYNNYVEAATENVMFGGANPSITNNLPSDIQIQRNYFKKNTAWIGGGYAVKNLFELKLAQRVLVDSNVMEYNWSDAQNGYAILFQTVDTAAWAIVEDVTFTNNIVRHSANGMNLCGICISNGIGVVRLYVHNNLFDDINGTTWDGGTMTGGGAAYQLINNVSNATFDHNTTLNQESDPQHPAMSLSGGTPSSIVDWTNNIVGYNLYGIYGDGVGVGTPAIAHYLPGGVVTADVLAAFPSDGSTYPAGNFFPTTWTGVGFTNYNGGNGGNYQLTSMSAYHNAGTDGTDIGANIPLLDSLTQGVINGTSGSSMRGGSATYGGKASAQ